MAFNPTNIAKSIPNMIEKANSKIVRLILRSPGIDVSAKAGDGHTSLIIASSNGHLEIIKLLLTAPVIDFTLTNEDLNDAAVMALASHHEKIVALIPSTSGLILNIRQNHNMTPLSYAAFQGHYEVVKILTFDNKLAKIGK